MSDGKDEMSNGKDEMSDGKEKQLETELNLFKAKGVSKPEYWQCILHVAPTKERKKWKAKDAIGVYCKVCELEIPYSCKTNPLAVQRHMEKKHLDLLKSYTKKSNLKTKCSFTTIKH